MSKPTYKAKKILTYPVFVKGYVVLLLDEEHPYAMTDRVITSQIQEINKDEEGKIISIVTANSNYIFKEHQNVHQCHA